MIARIAWRLQAFIWRLPILSVLVLGGCAHYRQQKREIAIIRAGCIEAAQNIPADQLDAYEADCVARIREVEASR